MYNWAEKILEWIFCIWIPSFLMLNYLVYRKFTRENLQSFISAYILTYDLICFTLKTVCLGAMTNYSSSKIDFFFSIKSVLQTLTGTMYWNLMYIKVLFIFFLIICLFMLLQIAYRNILCYHIYLSKFHLSPRSQIFK